MPLCIDKIYSLSNQEIEDIYFYLKQWRKSLFTNITNKTKATKIIENAYKILNLSIPKIIFCSSNINAISFIKKNNLERDTYNIIGCDEYQQLNMKLALLTLKRELLKDISRQNFVVAEILGEEREKFEYISYGIYDRL
jgi:transcriptional antiterminator Rof (Rho-off)